MTDLWSALKMKYDLSAAKSFCVGIRIFVMRVGLGFDHPSVGVASSASSSDVLVGVSVMVPDGSVSRVKISVKASFGLVGSSCCRFTMSP